jgi:tetraether lipid synthase
MSDTTIAPKRRLSLVSRAPAPKKTPIELITADLAALSVEEARVRFELAETDRPLKSTVSLCPACLAHTAAIVFVRAGRVLIRKQCREHGLTLAVLENDEAYYRLSNRDRSGRRYAEDRVIDIPDFIGAITGSSCCADGESCGDVTDQTSNKTCTILVEVTNACNLACPVCYSDAKGDKKMPLETFKRYIEKLVDQKGGLDSVQLTGGEATIHPEFWEMVSFLHASPAIKKIYIPTNGIELAREGVSERLLPYRDKVMVLLQFDGTREPTRELRAATLENVRDTLLDRLDRLGVPMQLTMTIARGVNDREVGWVVDRGMRHRSVKVVALQPVTYSGRYEIDRGPMDRATLSDIAKAVVTQARLRTAEKDFVPIPCSHPNCGWITLYLRRFGLEENIVRFIDLPKVMGDVANRAQMSTSELKGVVGSAGGSVVRKAAGWAAKKLVRADDVFAVAIKPFMDKYSYDQDRIAACCHHLMDTKGTPVSFCEYNALTRPGDSWEGFPAL